MSRLLRITPFTRIKIPPLLNPRGLNLHVRPYSSFLARHYNSVLSKYVRERNPMAAQRTIDKMIREGFQPDRSHYHQVLQAFFYQQDYIGAIKYFDSLKEQGIALDSVLYSTIIECHASMRYYNKARAAYEECLERCPDARGNPNFHATMVDACYRAGEMDAGDAILLQMIEMKNFTQKAFVTLIEACVWQKDSVRAISIVRHMEAFGFTPELRHLNRAIRVASRAGDTKVATELMDEILRRGYTPTHQTYRYLLATYAASKDMDAGKKIYDSIPPDIKSHPTVRAAYAMLAFASLPIKKAAAIFNEVYEGAELHAHSFDEIVMVLSQQGKFPAASAFVTRLHEEGIQPSVKSLSYLIQCVKTPEDYEKIWPYYERMKKSQTLAHPNPTYIQFLRLAATNGKCDHSKQIYEDLKALGTLGINAFNALNDCASLTKDEEFQTWLSKEVELYNQNAHRPVVFREDNRRHIDE